MADRSIGRAWTLGELRSRDWDTLHQLWWVCVKERNRLATEKIERKRIEGLYGDYESEKRDETVQETMKAILETLAERQLAYQEAFELAKQDPAIDLARTDGPQYTQPPYVCSGHFHICMFANAPCRIYSKRMKQTRRRTMHSQNQRRTRSYRGNRIHK